MKQFFKHVYLGMDCSVNNTNTVIHLK